MHTVQKKTLKHKNINRPKITAGLSIKLSIDVRQLILTETQTVGCKRLLLFCTWGLARTGSGGP